MPKPNFIVSFEDEYMGRPETLYARELIAPEDEDGEWDVGTTSNRAEALTLPADVAAFIADIFEGEVEEK